MKFPTGFNPTIPEIYQLEVTNACQFSCDFCPRTSSNRHIRNLDLTLAKIISERDLAGSYFVEFQLSGEPLLHPDISTIIDYFKGKVLTGLSTNGMLISKQLEALLKLDYLTVSIDSLDDYETLRKGGKSNVLWDNLEVLFRKRPSSLAVDFQIIELDKYNSSWKKDLEKLQEIVKEKKWEVNIRTTPDCFLGIRDKMKIDCSDLCLNPWLSVSIQSDGDVVPCCFAFGKDIVYGNLTLNSLEEIWQTSIIRKNLQYRHLTGQYFDLCGKCYMRSPTILHENIFRNSMSSRLKLLDK